MTDELDDYFRCVKQGERWEFHVAVIQWDGHTPGLAWKTFRCWRTQPTAERLAQARSSALKTSRFFRVCIQCGTLTNAGHLHDNQTCQDCAERLLGVVY